MATSSVPNRDVLSKLDIQLTCAICHDRYTDPRILPCQHTYCKDCIDGLEHVEAERGRPNEVRCPECRQLYRMNGGTAVLQSAFLVNNFLEIDELLRTIPRPVSCSEHKKPKNVYCEQCDELICFKCSHGSHRDHPSDLAEDLFDKHRQQISDSLQPVNVKITEVLQMLNTFKETEEAIKAQGEVVKKEISQTIQQHLDRLQVIMGALRQAKQTLITDAEIATRRKLELHELEQSELETVLVQLQSCKEFVEEKLRSQSQYQIQTAKKKLVERISETHSNVKVSNLKPPGQRADTAFERNLSSLPAFKPPDVGSVKSTLNYQSVHGLFSVDIPHCVPAREITEVSLMTSLPELVPARQLHCYLEMRDNFEVECSVLQEGNGRFTVDLEPEQPGIHELSVCIDNTHIHGSPFEVPVMSIAQWREPRVEKFAEGLKHPHGVAVTDDEKYVIVTESQRNCVTVFSADTGELVRRFGKHGNRPGELENPKEVAVSTDGHIFVMDNHHIQKFTATGVCRANLSRSARHIGYGLAVLPPGGAHLVTCSKGENMVIQQIDSSLGKFFESISDKVSDEGYDIAVDTKGLMYVLTKSSGIHKFSPDGKHIGSFGSKGNEPHQFKVPCELCIDAGNTIYITDGPKIKMFTVDGEFLGTFCNQTKLRGITVSKGGDLYICRANGEVLVSRGTLD